MGKPYGPERAEHNLYGGEAPLGQHEAGGCLRLNAALMHCPMALCDYVIVHELAHLTHPDHSPAFHALVRATLPCADELRARMRAFAGVTTLLAAPKEDDA